MKSTLDEDKPIYLQIKEHLEDSIINEAIKVGERVPSTNEFAKYYQINPATAAKDANELVAERILFKKGVLVCLLARALGRCKLFF